MIYYYLFRYIWAVRFENGDFVISPYLSRKNFTIWLVQKAYAKKSQPFSIQKL